ncbi:hypothetical protein Lal_00034605 [Lupinus albus]|nr:hypothetical protein Lal_00034605 [Lupinus albus]
MGMVIIRDIVNDFSDDEDIELCFDDDEDLELGSSENSVDYIVVESRPDRYVGQCKYFGSECQWRIRASLNGKRDLWEIRKINGTHTCIVTRFGYTVTYRKAWTAKQIAMSQIYGDWEESYKELPRWFNTVQCYALGAIVRYATSRHDDSTSLILDRVFWAFKPCIEGFGLCKPILQVDGTLWVKISTLWVRYQIWLDHACHLYNDYKWQQKHDQWIQIWNHREDYVINGLPNVQPLYHYSQYMQWYIQRTRKYISPDGAYSSGSIHYNIIRSIRDQCASSTVHDNPIQFIHGVYLQCNEMMDAFAKLLPTAFSDSNYQAPPTNQFDTPVAPEFQQPFESQTQTDTHPRPFTQQTPVPQQQPFQFQSFGALCDYSISHQFGSSSHYEESLPTMFGTTSTTPLSAFNSQQYYQPTMPTQVDDEDDDEEDEEVPQLVRGETRQPTQPSLRVQLPRRRRPPPCDTSSHRRH